MVYVLYCNCVIMTIAPAAHAVDCRCNLFNAAQIVEMPRGGSVRE